MTNKKPLTINQEENKSTSQRFKIRINKYKLLDYMYNSGALTIKGFNDALRELNLSKDELKVLNYYGVLC